MTARLRRAIGLPEAGAIAVTLVFLAISAWWLATDLRIVNLDNAKHLLIAARWHESLVHGHLLEPFTEFANYPPGIHLVGAISDLLLGISTFGMVFASNVVFVPLLALGCYGAARVAFGRTAGVLAALFAFATPMIMSLFHVFLPDAPQAAMVALTVWLLLASDRFSRVGVAGAAGVAAGLGMYTKGTFVAFIAGILAAMMLRGGWRNWKGVLAFALVGAAIAGPWYIGHYGDLRPQTTGAVGAVGVPIWYGNVPWPTRSSVSNYSWYGWALVNHQLYLPLTLFFVTGLGWAVWRLVRRPWTGSHLPELLAGGAVGYLAMSLLLLKDPRYTLPCLVYVAVLGTAWIACLPRRPRIAVTALLVGVFVFNTVTHNFGVGGVHGIRTPWTVSSPIGEYSFMLVNETGYFEGGPDRRVEPLLDLFDRLYDRGARAVVLDEATLGPGGYHNGGLTLLVVRTKLGLPGFIPEYVTKPTDAWVTRAPIRAVGRRPCIVSPLADDGTGIYVYRGRVPKDLRRARPDCP
jgi:hypothetical protein